MVFAAVGCYAFSSSLPHLLKAGAMWNPARLIISNFLSSTEGAYAFARDRYHSAHRASVLLRLSLGIQKPPFPRLSSAYADI